jgi:hypothetical protein
MSAGSTNAKVVTKQSVVLTPVPTGSSTTTKAPVPYGVELEEKLKRVEASLANLKSKLNAIKNENPEPSGESEKPEISDNAADISVEEIIAEPATIAKGGKRKRQGRSKKRRQTKRQRRRLAKSRKWRAS